LIEDRAKYWARRAAFAIGLSFVTFLIAFPSCCSGMAWHYQQQHPHGSQNQIAAFYFAAPVAALLACLMFAALMLRAYVWRQKKIAEFASMATAQDEEPRG
jgi:cytochrome bd-type quinol oxidase subunit 2